MSKSLARYVLDGAVYKPITVFRDVAILWVLGISGSADSYFAAISVVLLGQAMATGSLANAWIPNVIRMEPAERKVFILASTRQEIIVAGLQTSALVAVMALILKIMSPTHALRPYFSTLVLLMPVWGMAYLSGCIGNFLFSCGRCRSAQFVWALPSMVLVAMIPVLHLWDPDSRLQACVGATYFAYAVGVLVGGVLLLRSCDSTVLHVFALPKHHPVVPLRVRLLSSLEVGAFALMSYGLLLLPSTLGAGATALLAFAVRLYSALGVVLITPISQGILVELSRKNSATEAKQGALLVALGVVAGCALVVPLAGYVGVYIASELGMTTKAILHTFPALALAWLPIFAGMAAIQILSRQLATTGVVAQVSLILAIGYTFAGICLWVPVPFGFSPIWGKWMLVYGSLAVVCLLLLSICFSKDMRNLLRVADN